jgi:hypothetical protein
MRLSYIENLARLEFFGPVAMEPVTFPRASTRSVAVSEVPVEKLGRLQAFGTVEGKFQSEPNIGGWGSAA